MSIFQKFLLHLKIVHVSRIEFSDSYEITAKAAIEGYWPRAANSARSISRST